MDKYLADPNLCPGYKIMQGFPMMEPSPVRLLGLPPIVNTKHDGEGAGGQQLLVVVVVQAVGCCQGKSVSNLRGSNKLKYPQNP